MKEFKPLEIKKFAKKTYKNNEMKKYKKFKEVEKQNLSLSCADVVFCTDNPNLLMYYALDTLYYYDISTNTTVSNYPMCTGQITAGNIRRDGRIIVTGFVNGKINIYEASKKLVLKNFSNHKLQVNSIDFSDNIVNFVSSSNDMSFKLYDLSSNTPIRSFDKSHSDYVKKAKYINQNIVASGSYDKKIKLWDLRNNENKPVKVYDNVNINHDILPINDECFISTAENLLNFWDIRMDDVLNQANPIQNNIVKLCSDNGNTKGGAKTRLFTVSHGEKFIKVLELNSLKSLYSVKLKNDISAFDIAPQLDRFAVGFSNGDFSIRTRPLDTEDDELMNLDQEERDIRLLDPSQYADRAVVKNYKYFYRGQHSNEVQDNEITAAKGKKVKLQDYDIYLKKFQYHNALDAVLKKNNVEIILSLIEELIDRNALKIALMNRTEEELVLLLNFIKWKIRDPKATNVLIYVLDLVIEYYMVMLDKSPHVTRIFREINNIIQDEIKMENDLNEINNKIDLLININSFN